MATFNAPTVSEVQSEVGLRPENVNKMFSVEDYEDIVAARLAVETVFIEERTGTATLTANQSTLATQATLLRTAASIEHMAGQLNERYKAEAMDYERRASEVLDTLMGSISGTVDGNGPAYGAATLSSSPYRFNEDLELVVNG